MGDEYKVKIKTVRECGIIVYDVDSILEGPHAKRHLQFLRELWIKQQAQLKKQKKQ